MHLLSHDFWTNDFCGNNFSLFFEILVGKYRMQESEIEQVLNYISHKKIEKEKKS